MRKHHYKLQAKDDGELNITTFMNLMVVLVPFLLITAVFSRMAVIELNLPSANGGPTPKETGFRPEVIVRDAGIEITNGTNVIAQLPKVDGKYDLETLSRYMVSLKQDNPDVDAISVLLERKIPYDYLVQVTDVVRSVQVPDQSAEHGVKRVALFTAVAVGDAP